MTKELTLLLWLSVYASACASPLAPSIQSIASTTEAEHVAAAAGPPALVVDGVRRSVVGPTECIARPSATYTWSVVVEDAGPSRLHFARPMAFHSDDPGCEEVHDRPKEWFRLTGQADYRPHTAGTTQFHYDSREVACGRVQVDASLLNDAGETVLILGRVINYGVRCSPPPPPPPTVPVPPHVPTPTPPELTCPPDGQAIILQYPRYSSLNIVSSGGATATATFWIAPGCANVQVSLVSYQKYTDHTFMPQRFVVGNFAKYSAGGPYTLTVPVVHCSMQADLRFGGFVQGEDLTETNEANDYGPRTLDWNYNDAACSGL